jgi:thioester reductase-like protein
MTSSNLLEVALLRRHAAHVAAHRLEDDARDLIAGLLEELRHRIGVVVGDVEGVLGEVGRHAR